MVKPRRTEGMTTASSSENVLTVTSIHGATLVFSPETDSRVDEAIDDKLFTKTELGAVELAAELNAWGVPEARALGYAVVFWS